MLQELEIRVSIEFKKLLPSLLQICVYKVQHIYYLLGCQVNYWVGEIIHNISYDWRRQMEVICPEVNVVLNGEFKIIKLHTVSGS